MLACAWSTNTLEGAPLKEMPVLGTVDVRQIQKEGRRSKFVVNFFSQFRPGLPLSDPKEILESEWKTEFKQAKLNGQDGRLAI